MKKVTQQTQVADCTSWHRRKQYRTAGMSSRPCYKNWKQHVQLRHNYKWWKQLNNIVLCNQTAHNGQH